MLGRSMGGGVTLNALVAKPGLVDAAVIYASVSSRFLDNLDHCTGPKRPEAAAAFFDQFGTPQEEPRFYRGLSARTYFDRITEPVLMHHGTLDDSCPPPGRAPRSGCCATAGVDSRLAVVSRREHAFGPRWQDSIAGRSRSCGASCVTDRFTCRPCGATVAEISTGEAA